MAMQWTLSLCLLENFVSWRKVFSATVGIGAEVSKTCPRVVRHGRRVRRFRYRGLGLEEATAPRGREAYRDIRNASGRRL